MALFPGNILITPHTFGRPFLAPKLDYTCMSNNYNTTTMTTTTTTTTATIDATTFGDDASNFTEM